MGPPPKILFEFDKDDTFLKHRSLLVKQYERRKILVYMYVLRTHLLHPSSYVFERHSPERLFIPAIEKDTCRKIWWGAYTLDRMLAFAPLPPSAPTRFMPQLMRSVTDRAIPVREDRNVENAARAPSDPALPKDNARRVSIDNIYQRRSPASPLETQPPSSSLPYAEHRRRVATSRLATPARFGANAPAAPVFCVLHCHLRRPFREHGTMTRHRRSLTHHRLLGPQQTAWSVHARGTCEDGVHEGRPTARERLGYTPRNRNRSLSAGGGKNERVTSPAPRSAKWLGPRPAKAFAAAGLLDRDVSKMPLALRVCEASATAIRARLPPAGLRSRKQALSRVPGLAQRLSDNDALRGYGPRFGPHFDGCTAHHSPQNPPLKHRYPSRVQSRTPSPQQKNY
jgi:hypothetical protein